MAKREPDAIDLAAKSYGVPRAQIVEFVFQTARQAGKDPQEALRIAKAEGLDGLSVAQAPAPQDLARGLLGGRPTGDPTVDALVFR